MEGKDNWSGGRQKRGGCAEEGYKTCWRLQQLSISIGVFRSKFVGRRVRKGSEDLFKRKLYTGLWIADE